MPNPGEIVETAITYLTQRRERLRRRMAAVAMPRQNLAPLIGLRPWCGLGPYVRRVDVSCESQAPAEHFNIS